MLRNFSEKGSASSFWTQAKAGHRLAKTGSKSRKFEGEGATSKEQRVVGDLPRWGSFFSSHVSGGEEKKEPGKRKKT